MSNEKQDVYTRITNKIIADLEQGVRTWMKPWNAGNTAGRITRPLRHNGVPYSGINILMLWAEAMDKGFTASTWMTFKQALELGANVRKGEKGSLVVYANSITRVEENDKGEEAEHEIHYMKGYTVFNVSRLRTCRNNITASPAYRPPRSSASPMRKHSFRRPRPIAVIVATAPFTALMAITSRCRSLMLSQTQRASTLPSPMSPLTGRDTRSG
jgi:hypothetical protein